MKCTAKGFWAVLLLLWMASMPVSGTVIPIGRLPGGQFWSSNSVGVVGGIPNVTTIYTNFWPTNGTWDNINRALRSCPSNQVVYLNAGTYAITDSLTFGPHVGGNNGVVLRGAGIGQTRLRWTGGSNSKVFIGGNWSQADDRYWKDNKVDWTSGYEQGSTNITIANNNEGFQVGDMILLSQENDPNLVNPQGTSTYRRVITGADGEEYNQMQWVRIAAIDNNTNLTIWPGVYMTNYRASQNPVVFWTGAHSIAQKIGLEDMTFDMSALGNHSAPEIEFIVAYNCWVDNISVTNVGYAGVKFNRSAHCTAHNSIVTYSSSGGTSSSYGFNAVMSSDILIQNNSTYRITAPVLLDNGTSGCVISYNFCTNMLYGLSPGWMPYSLNTHGAHPTMNLFEGNVGTGIAFDTVHGSSSHNTVFRNAFSGYQGNLEGYGTFVLNNTYVMGVMSWNRDVTVVGNVLGTDGYHSNYQVDVVTYPSNYGNIKSIYLLGFWGNYTALNNADPETVTSLLRTGNYDAVNDAIVWDASGAQTLPDSLYLGARPSWWNNAVPFPPIGADLVTRVSPIPAQLRFEAFLTGGDTSQNDPPRAPSGLRVVLGAAAPSP